MTNEERDLITRFFSRVGGAGQPGGGFSGGSVPATAQPLPPVDREADELIAQQFQTHPEARYRITQTAIVQEAALAEAQNRLQRLQWELEQTRQAAQQVQAGGGQSRGFFSSLFGGGAAHPGAYRPTMPPPQPQYPPNYQPGMFQRTGGGSGFLGSALTTAAGVAGGMVVGNALMSAFSGHEGGGGGFLGGGGAGGASPWDGAGTSVGDPAAGWTGDAGGGGADPWGGGGMAAPDQPSFDGGGDPFGGGGGGGSDPFGGGGGSGFDSGGFDSSNT